MAAALCAISNEQKKRANQLAFDYNAFA